MLAGAARTDSLHPEEPEEPGLPVVGEVVAGKYLIERRLGSGGMGIVVAARNILLDDPVAIKFLRPSAAKDDESVHRFVREAKSARRIQSEHVVRVQDVSYLEIGTPYMIMELLHGEDLAQLVESRGVLSVTNAVDYLVEACAGIAEAHALGIVHRDLKPANMFLAKRNDGTRVVKVLDFGISKAMGDTAQNPNMTDTRATFGSPTYMSPEQIRSAKRVDFRTDIWSLGVCLHEVLTARPPFLAETVAGLLASIIADAPVPVRQERPDVSADLEAVILQCLEKNLSRRFQTIGDLVSALRPFASASSEGSISRVLRLSPPSYPGSAAGVTASDSYPVSRAPSPSYSSYSSIRVEPPASLRTIPTAPAPLSAHARTEQSFDTSRALLVAPEVRPAPRRTAVVVASVLGALLVIALGAGVTVFRHRSFVAAAPPVSATTPTSATIPLVADDKTAPPPSAPATASPSAPPTAMTPAVPVAPVAPVASSVSIASARPTVPHAEAKGNVRAKTRPGAAADAPPQPATPPSTTPSASKDGALNAQF